MLRSSLCSWPPPVSPGNEHPRTGPSGDFDGQLLAGKQGASFSAPGPPTVGLSLQVPEGVPHRAVPALRATQMHAASALHLLPLALREPAPPPLHPPSGRHVQLQPRRLLHQVRRGHGPLPRGRRVSVLQPALGGGGPTPPGSRALRVGLAKSERPPAEAAVGAALQPGPGIRPCSLWAGPFSFSQSWGTLHRPSFC